MPSPPLADEITFISGVDDDGTLPLTAYSAWNDGTIPADYSGGYTSTAKFGSTTAGTAGGTVYYYFDVSSAWTATEKKVFTDSLALWQAVANITFVETNNPAASQITLERGANGAYTSPSYTVATGAGVTGGSVLLTMKKATVSIDTSVEGFGPLSASFSRYGGYPYMTVLHELGHALGLGHGGAYNETVTEATQQFSAYDTRLWSIMSYIDPDTTSSKYFSEYTVTGTNWGWSAPNPDGYRYGMVPTTWMPLDILALQRLYGAPTSTPLSSNLVFGFNCNISTVISRYFDFTVNSDPVVTLFATGGGNTLDLSGFLTTDANTVSLVAGTFSSCDGRTNNIGIAYNTAINTYVGHSGVDTVTCNDNGDTVHTGAGNDTITGGAGSDWLYGQDGNDRIFAGGEHDFLYGGTGNDTIDGGSNVDIAVFSGNRSGYTITQGVTGTFTVVGADGTDVLTNVEYASFDDQIIRLLPGTGVTVDWNAAPSTYMAGIRDFDGADLGSLADWKLIGTADLNGDGTAEHIMVNRGNGRWAEVSTEADGKVYFSNFGWAGDTRIVGIYIDPLVALGLVEQGSDYDSQRRFQNDLNIENINNVLGSGDYNHDGLQEVYFSLTDGTAYLHAYMHADGNIQYANYQSQQQVIDFLTSNGWSASTYTGWFTGG